LSVHDRFTDFVIDVWRDAVTTGLSLPDLKPSNIGLFKGLKSNSEDWKLIDHDMMSDAVQNSWCGTFGEAPAQIGQPGSWIAQTRWAALATIAWTLATSEQKVVILDASNPHRYSIVETIFSTHVGIKRKLTEVGLV
jgi:hypothetical protein